MQWAARCFLLLASVDAQAVKVLDVASYDAFAAKEGTFLLKFFAPWCGHSRALAPEYEAVAAELSGKLPVAEVDGTVNDALATKFDVKGYPTIFFVRDGTPFEFSGDRTSAKV